eukprot:4777687-Pyramimonas_sp.AAC.1
MGTESIGYTCWLAGEIIGANKFKLIVGVVAAAGVVGVVVVEFSFLEIGIADLPGNGSTRSRRDAGYMFYENEVPARALAG